MRHGLRVAGGLEDKTGARSSRQAFDMAGKVLFGRGFQAEHLRRAEAPGGRFFLRVGAAGYGDDVFHAEFRETEDGEQADRPEPLHHRGAGFFRFDARFSCQGDGVQNRRPRAGEHRSRFGVDAFRNFYEILHGRIVVFAEATLKNAAACRVAGVV